MTAVARFPRNRRGTDYVVGDIHGMYHLLDAELGRVGFNSRRDRLFSVGDLVDRGPDSARALEFIKRPWFHAVRGNHDQFVIDARSDPLWFGENGGAWWQTAHPQTRRALSRRFQQLPFAIEVETASGTVGLVHADIPGGTDWTSFIEQVESEPVLQQTALWGRNRFYQQDRSGVGGIWRMYCGHSITRDFRPTVLGNVWFIDTGAWCQTLGETQARLTVLPIDQDAP